MMTSSFRRGRPSFRLVLGAALALMSMPSQAQTVPPDTPSVLEILTIATGQRRVVATFPYLIEAPNWSRDGGTLVYNSLGRLYRIPVAGGAAQRIDTGPEITLNNDHGLSPDGAWIAISDQTRKESRVYVLPAAGGTPREVTPVGPSYWHGWSPDGATLAFVGLRDGAFSLYAVPVAGGAERRLTSAKGHDDGPDYGADGTIYFNSDRSGHMHLWKMGPDGSGQTQITTDDAYGDWFPHPSPDNRQLVFLSYDGRVAGHPPGQHVRLRLLPIGAKAEPRVLADLYGGQGTINVSSWSPDSREIAFVSYAEPAGKP